MLWWPFVLLAAVTGVWYQRLLCRRGLCSARHVVYRSAGAVLMVLLVASWDYRHWLWPSPDPLFPSQWAFRALVLLSLMITLVAGLVLVALLDARETLRRYEAERRRLFDERILHRGKTDDE